MAGVFVVSRAEKDVKDAVLALVATEDALESAIEKRAAAGAKLRDLLTEDGDYAYKLPDLRVLFVIVRANDLTDVDVSLHVPIIVED